jgi:organic hydroperoxide reductase OsmC/OhrA
MATYQVTVLWHRAEGEAFIDQRYSRAHTWRFDGGAAVSASSSPHVVRIPYSDPAAVDPEEAYVAALASCHMLFLLSFAARQGFRVATYTDTASGIMTDMADGRTWMSQVTLRPHIVFDGAPRPSPQELDELHHAAHAACFLANSVKTTIVVEPPADPT